MTLTSTEMLIQREKNVKASFREGFHKMSDANRHLLALSAQIVAAHAGNNDVGLDALPMSIRNVYNVLATLEPSELAHATAEPDNAMDEQASSNNAVESDHGHAHDDYVHPVYGQTVFTDHLICMEDGIAMKMLKRHLLTVHGMNPDEYRKKWGLPADYPMVSSNYAKLRSSLALKSGLGLKPDNRLTKSRKRVG